MCATRTRRGLGPVLTALCLLAFASAPARAQEAGTPEQEPDRSVTVIEVGEDGTVTVDGEPVSGDGRVVIRVPDGDRTRDRDVHVLRNGRIYVGDDGDVEVRGLDGERLRNFRVQAPDAEAMFRLHRDVEQLRMDVPDALMRGIAPGEVGFIFGGESAEVMRLEREARKLTREIQQAEGAEQARLREELEAMLDEIFDAKLEHRRERAEKLRARLQEEESEIQQRQQRRDEIIERRLRDLLGEDDELDW